MSLSLRPLVLPPIEALFRILFTYDCLDEHKIPATGPVVIVSNHPSYLDPVLLSLQVSRPIRFMAWNALFGVPVLGPTIRAFGAFPVDTKPGQGRAAYEKAKELLLQGEVVGIFPEGHRSVSGWMEPHLREGAARLALETGAKLVPATIKGAFRAWPYFRSLPEPARITVRYHDPIDVSAWQGRPDEEALAEILAEVRRRVDKTLLPGVKADLKIAMLYRTSPPWPRVHEYVPALGLALFAYWKTRSFATIWPGYAYVGYCLLDLLVIPPRRLSKWIRNAASIFFTLFYAGWLLPRLGLPQVWGRRAIVAVVAGAAFPYLYERGRVALGFLQGMALAILLEMVALPFGPTGLGPHVALPLYAAAYAWERRTVFWRWSTPVLLAYVLWVTRMLGGGQEVLPHAIAGLLAWLVVRLLPSGSAPAAEESEPPVSPLGLGLGE
jgi:1-acyl-sn-glycerol-3-phosphate acyltransferase